MATRNILKTGAQVAPPLVAASILSADFGKLEAECRAALDAGADLLHLDVMDGHFVPNLSMGPAVCQSLRKALPHVCLDVHLMVTDPAKYVRPFADAGADHLTFHAEVVDDPASLAEVIREAGMTAGLALNPPTSAQAVVPWINHVDLVLVMSVNPGFAGQKFIPHVLEKVRTIKPRLRPGQPIEIDGGVGGETAAACIEAGCDVLVAASAIFHSPDYAQAIAHLRQLDAFGPRSKPRTTTASAERS